MQCSPRLGWGQRQPEVGGQRHYISADQITCPDLLRRPLFSASSLHRSWMIGPTSVSKIFLNQQLYPSGASCAGDGLAKRRISHACLVALRARPIQVMRIAILTNSWELHRPNLDCAYTFRPCSFRRNPCDPSTTVRGARMAGGA